MITDKDLAQALDRIARTADGEALYRYCQKQLMGTLADHAPKGSALRSEHGMRRFAAALMAHMRKGIDESGGSSGNPSGDQRSERLVVFASAKPAVAGRHVTARDHLRAHDPEFQRLVANTGTDDT